MTNSRYLCSPVGIAFVDAMAKKKKNKMRSLMVVRSDGLAIMVAVVLFFVGREGQQLSMSCCVVGGKSVPVQT